MEKIIVPNINNNETEAILVEWHVNDGIQVKKGQIVASMETTKSTYDLEAICDGFIKLNAEISKKYSFGESIGYIYNSMEEFNKNSIKTQILDFDEKESIIITEPAKELISKHKIDPALINSLGLKVIKANDIIEFLNKEINNKLIPLSPRQQGISKTVTKSKSTIPDAFLLKKVCATRALSFISSFTSEKSFFLSLNEILIFTTANLFSKFPLFFSTLIDECNIRVPDNVNIGVTIDVGKGLFVPVIKETSKLSINEISEKLMDFRMKAIRNNFNSEDLDGGNFSISINNDIDTIFVIPIIFPGQTCMLSIGAVYNEYEVNKSKELLAVQYFNLGLSYDHRIINGYEANLFLTALKNQLENFNY